MEVQHTADTQSLFITLRGPAALHIRAGGGRVSQKDQAPPPSAATRTDDFTGYDGPPVEVKWLPGSEEEEVVLNVHLAYRPSDQAADSLAHLMYAWHTAVSRGAHPGCRARGLLGPFWDEGIVRWSVQLQTERCGVALEDDLARRLMGWSHTWSVPVTQVTLGHEPL
jgi:hypothetical protein